MTRPESPTELNALQRFFYSHYVISGLRQCLGIMLVVAVAFYLHNALTGYVAGVGATIVAMIDRPAPWRNRIKEMLSGALLGALVVAMTGLALNHPIVLLVVMTAQAFFFSMLVVYGVRGATIGFACMTLAVLTMPATLSSDEVLDYTLLSLAGALAYLAYSMVSGYLMQLREQQQCLSVSLFATANYIKARSQMYDTNIHVDEGYRALMAAQTQMISSHEGLRDAALESMSRQNVQGKPKRLMVWNLMTDMVYLVDQIISTQTDYTLLHKTLAKSAVLAHMRGALETSACRLVKIAQAVNHPKHAKISSNGHASGRSSDLTTQGLDHLAALQAEILSMKETGFAAREAETYTLCVEIFRRLQRVDEIVAHMAAQTGLPANATPLNPSMLETSLERLMSSQSFDPKQFFSQLRLDTAPCRHALRVSLAVAIAMFAGMQLPEMRGHGYWIVLTVVVIMKPAFSLTQKRNKDRLAGTLMGCALAFVLLHISTEPDVLLGALIIASILSFVFTLSGNYLLFSAFLSMSILLLLHGLLPHPANLPTERAIDTVIGSLIALACSFVLPWWEAKSLPTLAANAIAANQRLLHTGITALKMQQLDPLAWQFARQSMFIAFSQFVQAFNRMMGEPPTRQAFVTEYSRLTVIVHVMAAEIVNVFNQTQGHQRAMDAVLHTLVNVNDALQTMDASTIDDINLATDPLNLANTSTDLTDSHDLSHALAQLQASTRSVIEIYNEIRTSNNREQGVA